MGIKELNKRGMFTADQLKRWKKFQGKFLNVYPIHYEYWKDGIGYETVYAVRGISSDVQENFQTVDEILSV